MKEDTNPIKYRLVKISSSLRYSFSHFHSRAPIARTEIHFSALVFPRNERKRETRRAAGDDDIEL